MERLLGENDHVNMSRIDNGGPIFSYYINQEEIWMGRSMAERSNILRGQFPIYGWFSEDAIESNETMVHMKRLNTSTYLPGLRLLTHEEGTDYLDYVRRIANSGNHLAIAVKLNDLQHNLKRGREKGYKRLVEKHEAALKEILSSTDR